MEQLTVYVLLFTLLLGGALGFIGGLFGFGGGIIAIPVLVIGFGLDQAVAQGTALVMMVPNLLLGWYRYNQRHATPVGSAVQIGLSACLTTWLMAHVAVRLDPQLMRSIFSAFLFCLSVHMLWRRPDVTTQAHEPPRSTKLLPLVGVVGGSSMGLLGIGGGLLATPIFTGWFCLRQTVAQSFSLALVAPSSIIALMTYSMEQRVDWHIGLPLALGGLFTVSAGVTLAHRLPEKSMRKAFAWMLLLTAVWMLAKPILLK